MRHWIQAARLRTLPLSLSGVVLGSFLAFSEVEFKPWVFFLACLTTILYQVLSNFANDYGDGIKGTDKDKIGEKRAVESGLISSDEMLRMVKVFAVLSLLSTIVLVLVAFGKENTAQFFLLLGLISIVAAIKYTMGGNAYGYSGLGDLFVFVFFGLVAVLGSEYLYTHQLNFMNLLPAISIGFLSMAVLNLNNMRDLETDKKANKNTLVVQIGLKRAKAYHFFLLVFAFFLSLVFVLVKSTSYHWSSFLFLLVGVPLMRHLLKVREITSSVEFDPELKVVALSTFVFALLLGGGLFLSDFS